MSESSTATVVGTVVGIIATLLTILLTPGLKHRFWKRPRLAELRFEVADKINWLLAEYITDHTAHEGSATPNRPSTEFFRTIRYQPL